MGGGGWGMEDGDGGWGMGVEDGRWGMREGMGVRNGGWGFGDEGWGIDASSEQRTTTQRTTKISKKQRTTKTMNYNRKTTVKQKVLKKRK